MVYSKNMHKFCQLMLKSTKFKATKKNHHRKPLSRIYNASLQFIQNPHEGTLTMALHYIWAKLISEGPFFYLYISQISQWSLHFSEFF